MLKKFTFTLFSISVIGSSIAQNSSEKITSDNSPNQLLQINLMNFEAELYMKKKLEIMQQSPETENTKTSLLPPNPSCTNMDFELGSASGWTITNAPTITSNNSCLMTSCCSGTVPTYSVLSNGYIDPLMPTIPLNSQFGTGGTGSKFIKLNDAVAGGDQQRLAQSFSVSASNALFKYAYKFVSTGGGHACCDEAFMNVRFKNASGNTIPLAQPFFSVTLSSSCPTGYTATTAGTSSCSANPAYQHTPWIYGSADLSAYIGSFVTFELTVGDCSGAGHTGHVYFDATCSGLTYSVNGSSMQLDSVNNVCVTSLPTILSAPAGFAAYAWMTPLGPVAGPTVNATVYGAYTMSLTSIGTCCAYLKTVNLSSCTGITESKTKSTEIFLYPNPTKKEIFFENVGSGSEYVVYDMLGNKIREKEPISESKKADISEFNSGIYFFKISTLNGQMKTFKIVKD